VKVQPSIREAAVLLSCLPPRYASRILDRLNDQDARAIRKTMADVSQPTPTERSTVVREFLRQSERDDAPSGARRRFDAPQTSPPSFHFLTRMKPAEVAELIRDELSRTQAAVLSQLPPTFAAEVLIRLSDDRRRSVVQQLASLDPAKVPALSELAAELQQILKQRKKSQAVALPGQRLLHAMLAQTGGSTHETLAATVQACGIPVTGQPPTSANEG
jgi:flagellar motor switch protein FliG